MRHANDGIFATQAKLCTHVQHETGFRYDFVKTVLENVVHCAKNGLDYCPSQNYSKTGLKNGPSALVDEAPSAQKDAISAVRRDKSVRAGLVLFNEERNLST